MRPIDRLFEKHPQLPTIPVIVQELIASLGRDDVDLADLIRKVRQDQSLSARVLRLANSPYYGGRKTIGGIDDAVAMIGLNSLRSIVIASGVTGAIQNVPGVNLPGFWKHSQLTAHLARVLARQVGVNAEFAYAIGLMHRIGQLLIDMSFPDHARQIEQECRDLSVGELAGLERLHLGFDHAEVSAELARHWFFPEEIQSALRHYLRPDMHDFPAFACVVNIAASIAFGLEQDLPDDKVVKRINSLVVGALSLEDTDWLALVGQMRELLATGLDSAAH